MSPILTFALPWVISLGILLGFAEAEAGASTLPSPRAAQTAPGAEPAKEDELRRLAQLLVELDKQRGRVLDGLSAEDRRRLLELVEKIASPTSPEDSDPATPQTVTPQTEASQRKSEEDEDGRMDPAKTSIAVKDAGPGSSSRKCEAWDLLDTNGDGVLSGADRYWRHFFVWLDNGDGKPAADEMRDSFDLGMRSLSLDLRSVSGEKESTGVVERRLSDGRERLRVEIIKKSKASRGFDYGFLAIDVDGWERGDAPALREASRAATAGATGVTETTSGFVLVQDGLEILGEAGAWLPLLCGASTSP